MSQLDSRQLTDIHIHLLPGLDDGPAYTEAAITIARQAYDSGTRVAVCTPHLQIGHRDNTRSVILAVFRKFASALQEAGVPLQVLPGAEVLAHPSLPALHDAGELPTVGDHGVHLLLELPWTTWPPGLGELIFNLRQRGLEIILAHPERFPAVHKRPELVREWVEQGLMVQLNAPSLEAPESTAGRLAYTLLEEGLVHFIASDGHSQERPPLLGPLLDQLADRYGEQLILKAIENAVAVAQGATRHVPPLPASNR